MTSRSSLRAGVWFRRVRRAWGAGFGVWAGCLQKLGSFCNTPQVFLSPRFRRVGGGVVTDAGLWVSGWRFVVVIWAVILDVFCNGAVQKAVLAKVGNGVKCFGMLG